MKTKNFELYYDIISLLDNTMFGVGKMFTKINKIIKKIKEGEKNEYSKLVELFQQQIFRYCFFMLGQKEEAEDAAQEVFIKAYNNLDRFQVPGNFSAWLYKIAHNYCVNKLRQRKIISFLPINLDSFVLKATLAFPGEERELADDLKKALNQLTAVERSIVLMRVFEEKQYKEIAALLGYKPATLRKKYQRACEKMQKYLLSSEGGKKGEYDFTSII